MESKRQQRRKRGHRRAWSIEKEGRDGKERQDESMNGEEESPTEESGREERGIWSLEVFLSMVST